MRAHPEFRAGRTLLVLGVNALLASFMLWSQRPLSLRTTILVAPLVVGAVLELMAPGAARFVNVGYFGFVAAAVGVATVLSILHLLGFTEPEHVVVALWFVGLPSAGMALFLNWLYKVTTAERVLDGAA